MPHKVTNMHEGGVDKARHVYDPYRWVQNMTEAQVEDFTRAEGQFARMLMMKYDYLDKQILREYEFHSQTHFAEPVKIGDYIYYRQVDNPADNLTLYAFPVDELQRYGLT